MEELNQQLQKECITCKATLPLTPENWYWVWHSSKGKKYPESRCKNCSRERNKAWRQANRQKLQKNERRYNLSPKGIYKKLVQSERSWEVDMTQAEFSEWYLSQPKICYYCGLPQEMLRTIPDRYNNRTYRLTVDRVDSSKHYELNNIVLCCLRCNHIKGDFFTQSEMEQIGQNYIASKWRNYANQKTP